MGCLLPVGRNGCVGCAGCLLPLLLTALALFVLLPMGLRHHHPGVPHPTSAIASANLRSPSK